MPRPGGLGRGPGLFGGHHRMPPPPPPPRPPRPPFGRPRPYGGCMGCAIPMAVSVLIVIGLLLLLI